jgi:hypothetical protein
VGCTNSIQREFTGETSASRLAIVRRQMRLEENVVQSSKRDALDA